MSNAKEVGDDDFQSEVLEADTAVLVDFWAPWCGPCKALAPLLDEIAEEFSEQLKIVKINIDEHRRMASKYNVRGIPNLLFFKNGELLEQIPGSLQKPQLQELVKKVIS